MTDYLENTEDYKKAFENNYIEFISFHKGADLTYADFITREQKEWQAIQTILKERKEMFPDLPGILFEKSFEVEKAISEKGINGLSFLVYKCNAILKFLNDKLESLNSGHNFDKIEFDSDVFFNAKGFKIFDTFIKYSPSNKDDYSFIYRKLIHENYMKEISHKKYKEYCAKKGYSDNLDKIKNMYQVENDNRNKRYIMSLDFIN